MFPRAIARHLASGRMRMSFATLPNTVANVTSVQCKDSVGHFLDRYDTFMFDCDGVLWKNDHITPIPGIEHAIQKLQALNKRVLYVTNNSIVSREALQRKFRAHGFESPLENIFGNGYSAAIFLKDILKVSGKVYLVGGAGMKWELDQVGLESVGIGSDCDNPTSDVDELLKYTLTDNIEAVLVGFDEHFSFNKIYKAATYICNPKCHFVATNNIEKGTFIGEADDRRRMPLTGTMVNAIAETANRKPVVVGKPKRIMLDCILRKHDVDVSRTVFIGDSLKADVGFAKRVGIDSALVLTGVSGINDIEDAPELTPNYVLNCLADIVT
ncbi:uncharacterized protein LOC123553412 [Mercenaria mercenaria]|uniref:uncharacterized protein LOC123553412 n=1 Tax=Mercenaria mercenaria TaxID=6596 RepID=UPI00234E6A2F|nr:uncharacterized protein LOC123553412 [Mercenaria mercenaria]